MIFDYRPLKTVFFYLALEKTNSLEVVNMIIYNNQEFYSFKELREKCHLISEREVSKVCGCWWKTVRKICEQNNIKKYSFVSNSQECFVYDDSIIDLIQKIRPVKNVAIPENYIPKKELIKY